MDAVCRWRESGIFRNHFNFASNLAVLNRDKQLNSLLEMWRLTRCYQLEFPPSNSARASRYLTTSFVGLALEMLAHVLLSLVASTDEPAKFSSNH
jgi:hypothetical protein